MWGAIIGDIAGSIYEFHNVKSKNIPLITPYSHFTDDTVLTIASMDYLLHKDDNPTDYFVKWAKKYPNAGYGGRFRKWIYSDDHKPYGSYGNGSAMRTSPAGWCDESEEVVLKQAYKLASVTHNHEEGIKGAVATTACIYLARKGCSKENIIKCAEQYYPNIRDLDYDDLVEHYGFNETCQGSVPQAIYCFYISHSYEDCIRTAISIGGDSDTIAAIAGSIAEAYWGIPEYLVNKFRDKLDSDMLAVVDKFYRTFVNTKNSPRLDKFIKAQEHDYPRALEEIKNERKETHWIWYIFPQIKGLGHSSQSEYYGLDGIREAELYYSHTILGERLYEITQALLNCKKDDITSIVGHPDDLKIKSCVTLFYLATRDEIFKKVLDKYYDGQLDENTMLYTINYNVKK